MAIGVTKWLTTIDKFLAHWAAANAALSPGELTLSGGYSRSGAPNSLVNDRDVVAAAMEAVQVQTNLLTVAQSARDIARVPLGRRFIQFSSAINAFLPGSRYLQSVPITPQLDQSPGAWHEAMDNLSNLWDAVDANTPPVPGFTPPLVLAGGYDLAAFSADSEALNLSFSSVSTFEQEAEQARAVRNAAFAAVYERLKQYRLVVQALFFKHDEVYKTLPLLK